ncbi:TRAP transporter substrate-binding protein [Clostridium sp. HBUAS56010]|uniref:TRAP transporter substrate-binding protein n=1 Tax=Clostridium sp. HBUAS56010 TaxID=2571127 RepID=UPI00117800C1|nr:TRAP transporter substrate-binding protein [Clostridium sp. HBUAS56010]
MDKRIVKAGGTAVLIVVLAMGILALWNAKFKEEFSLFSGRSTVPEYVFTYADNQPDDYPTTQGAKRFAQLVFERTNGRIKINVFSGENMGDENQIAEQLQYGGIDFARVSVMMLTDIKPKFNVLQLPYIYRDETHMWKVLDGTIGEEFKEELNGSGLVALSWFDAGARNFYNSSHPIEKIEDLRKMRIRVAKSDMMAAMVEALGAKAVPMAYSQVYAALETSSIDGAENNWPSYETMNHYEVAKYITLDAHSRIPEMQLASQSTWERLKKEDQEIIRACGEESALYERELWKIREESVKEKLKEAGCIVTELSPSEQVRFRASVMSVYQTYCSDYIDVVNRIAQER